jgi:hypothetical protein
MSLMQISEHFLVGAKKSLPLSHDGVQGGVKMKLLSSGRDGVFTPAATINLNQASRCNG